MARAYIFLHTEHIGGAEKRFAGLWKSLQGVEGEYFLVLQKQLYKILLRDSGLQKVMEDKKNRVHILDQNFRGQFRKQYYDFIKQFTTPGDVLHFVGEHPLIRLKGYQQVFSITQSSLKNMNFFGKAGQLLGVFYSDRVDILDPFICKLVHRLFFYKRKNIKRTTNSFCDTKTYTALPFAQKKDWFVFLGRFESVKQVIPLLNALPKIYQKVKGIAINDLHFYFLGYGLLEKEMLALMNKKEFQEIPVTIKFEDQPAEILRHSKIFFSVQLHNNYPSRSLIEALSCGNLPVVTDVGQTRWLAKPEYSFYVPEYFTEDDLVHTVMEVYKQTVKVLEQKSKQAREFILTEHTIEKMRDYYLSLYNQNQ